MFLGKFNVLGLNLTVCDHGFILNELDKSISNKKHLLVSPLASQTFVLAYFDKKLQSILNKFDFLFSDSIWVKKSVNFLYNLSSKHRIRGSNLVLRICNLAQEKKYKLFLYGTTEDTLKKLCYKLKNLYPELKIVGNSPSLFRDLRLEEKKELIKKIEKSNANILLIGLGSPLQETFTYNLIYELPHLHKPIIAISVGAAFDFISGVKPTAPKWMQEVGLEWLFRLINEPGRLWKRYLIYGSLFVFLIIIQKISSILASKMAKS